MSTEDVCLGKGSPQLKSHYSLPDALAASPGSTTLLLDGKPATHYAMGATHKLTIVPAKAAEDTWFLVDTGVGILSAASPNTRGGATGVSDFQVKCGGTRVGFMSESNVPVDLLGLRPAAIATSMESLSG